MRTGLPTPGQYLQRSIEFSYNVSRYMRSFMACWSLISYERIIVDVERFGGSFAVDVSSVSSSSRGLVGDTSFAILPNVKPVHTFLITIIFQSVFLVKLWRTPTYRSFLTALTLCGYTSYMFGWHVHEKAILLVLVPLR
jgi:alpha-1,3-glucosyltransferase